MIHARSWLAAGWIDALPPLWVRLVIGVGFFAIMATVELLQKGRAARRWREYCFLLAAVAMALVYGILNDQLTVGLSPEYFAYGKGLVEKLGPQFNRDPLRFRWEAAKIGMQATWTAGLFIGVALLLANNPRRSFPSLSLSRLFWSLPIVLLCCVPCAAILGIAGYLGGLAWISDDFAEMLRRDEFRPRRFMAVYGIHLGGYAGGLMGTVIAVVLIRRRRRATGIARSTTH